MSRAAFGVGYPHYHYLELAILLPLDCNSKGRELMLALLCLSLSQCFRTSYTACCHISVPEKTLRETFSAFQSLGTVLG